MDQTEVIHFFPLIDGCVEYFGCFHNFTAKYLYIGVVNCGLGLGTKLSYAHIILTPIFIAYFPSVFFWLSPTFYEE